MSTYIGSALPLALKSDLTESRDGVVIEHRRKVPTAIVNAYVEALRNEGIRDIRAEGVENTPFHIVSFLWVSDSTTAETILADIWSIAYNEEQLSIWALPAVRDQLRSIGYSDAATFRADTQAAFDGARSVTDEDGNTTAISLDILLTRAGTLGMDQSVIAELFRSLGDGVESYIESLPVIRRRMTAAANTTLSPALDNIGAIYSTSALVSAKPTIPSNLVAELPTAGYWIKKAPTAEQQEDGRWIYTEEYWYVKQYDPFIYQTVFE